MVNDPGQGHGAFKEKLTLISTPAPRTAVGLSLEYLNFDYLV